MPKQPQVSYHPPHDDDIPDAVYVDATAEDVSKLVNDQETEENELLQELGADERAVDIYVKIYKTRNNNRNLSYLFECTMADFPIIDKLRDTYGSGQYVGRIYKNKKLHRQLRWDITALPNFGGENLNSQTNETAVNAAINQQGQLMGELVSIVHQMKQAPAPVVQQNPMDPTAMVQMVTAMMSAMQQMIPAPPKVESPLALVGQVVNMMKDIQSDGKEKNMFDLVGDFLKSPLLHQAMEQSQQQAQQMYNRRPAIAPRPSGFATNAPPSNPSPSMMRVPAPDQPQSMGEQNIEPQEFGHDPYEGSNMDPAPNYTPQNNPAPEQAPQQQMSNEEIQFRQQLEILVQAAQRDADPDLYADLIEDNLPREIIDQFLSQPNPLEVLSNFHPGVNQYADWFKRLLFSLTHANAGSDNPPDASEHGTGPQPVNGNSERREGSAGNAQNDDAISPPGEKSPTG